MTSTAVLILACSPAVAGDLKIDWHSIDGGGGQSSNADLNLTGVIGQSDTIRMTAGNLSLSGGYLPLPPETGGIFSDGFE